MLTELIDDCPIDHKNEVLKNLVMSGGSTCFPYFDERILSEV
jgi:actin-related protein